MQPPPSAPDPTPGFSLGYDFLQVTLQDRVGTLTLNRPDKRNALNSTLVEELKHALARLSNEPTCRVIVLAGAGKAFCAGADLEYLTRMQDYSPEENLRDSRQLAELFLQLYTCPKPTVARVHGPALAGGCGLVTVCDVALAVPEATLGYTEVRIGFIPAIVSAFLLRKLGEGRARHLLVTGEVISAAKAEQYGLVHEVLAPEALDARLAELCQRLATQNAPGAMELTKRLIYDIPALPLPEGVAFATKMNAHARQTDECRRGIRAFLNKEELSW